MKQVAYDAQRTEFLEVHGYNVIRFWNNEVMDQTHRVMDAIILALEDNENKPTNLRLDP